jgi:hypothetical protein
MSVSSDSSESPQEGSDYTPDDGPATVEETDTEDVEIVEKPQKKHVCGMYLFTVDENH